MLIQHRRQTDVVGLGQHVRGWLQAKGFAADDLATHGNAVIVRAQEPTAWKKAIGASPHLIVRITPLAGGTDIDVRLGRTGPGVWAARYLTYSWVALGISFVTLKRELEQAATEWLNAAGGQSREGGRILGVVETGRTEHNLGTDVRRIDNRSSDTTVVRTIKASKRWHQSCVVEIEKSQVRSHEANINFPELFAMKNDVEDSVRQQYSISTDVEHTFEEEVSLTVPARTALVLYMDWKRIAQRGYVRIQGVARRTVRVPFEVDVGVTFDQRQHS